jgi:hypothetical protein
VGTFFLASTRQGEAFANRYQVLDQFVVSRGLLSESGVRVDVPSVQIVRDARVATPAGDPGRSARTRRGRGSNRRRIND